MHRRNFIKIALPAAFAGSAFATKDKSKPVLSFGVIADPQYADVDPKGSRHYRNSIKKLTDAVNELNNHSLDFVVTLGDSIDRDFNSFETILPLYEKLKSPYRFILGNHDFDVADDDKAKVTKALKMKHPYYSETIDNWHFIYLDGNDISTYRQGKEHPKTEEARKVLNEHKRNKLPQAQSWNGAVGKAQLNWLKTELETAKKNKKYVIVFNHFPIFPINKGHNLWNDKELTDLLTAYPNVVAYLNGHNHQGHYAKHKSCHFINFKGMVETADTNAFGIVHCYTDKIEINGMGAEPNRNLAQQ